MYACLYFVPALDVHLLDVERVDVAGKVSEER
jgi:hypothetical protein